MLEQAMSFLLAASIVLVTQIAFGLVFDPRYKDFQFAGLTPIIAAFAFYALVAPKRRVIESRHAEYIAASVFLGSGIYIAINETFANWQATWTGALLVVLSITLLRLARVVQRR